MFNPYTDNDLLQYALIGLEQRKQEINQESSSVLLFPHLAAVVEFR